MPSSLRVLVLTGFFALLVFPITVHAQNILLTGLNTNSDAFDQFTFVATNAIAGGTVYYFTDREYSDATGTFNTGESLFTYTTPGGGLPQGEVVRIEESSSGSNSPATLQCSSGSGATCGTVSSSGTISIGSLDEYYAFSASDPNNPETTVTEVLSYFTWQPSPLADADPTNDYPNAGKIVFVHQGGSTDLKQDFLYDNGSLSRAPRVNITRAEYNDVSNWTRTLDDLSDLSTTAFTNPMLDNSSLPVELVRFAARVVDNKVVLNWETASETNNAGFEVQQRLGDVFAPRSFVEGVGNTEAAQTYTVELNDVMPGLQVFRLKQVDFDGSFAYSPIVEVSVELPGIYSFSAPYPNPFYGETMFNLSIARDQHVQIDVFDLLGRQVRLLHSGTLEAQKPQAYRLDAGDLPGGLYLIRITGESFIATRQVTLLK